MACLRNWLAVVFFAVSSNATADIDDPLVSDIVNYIGTFGYMEGATRKTWTVEGKEYIGVEFESPDDPVLAVGIDSDFIRLEVPRQEVAEWEFTFSHFEAGEDNTLALWFYNSVRKRNLSGFVRIRNVQRYFNENNGWAVDRAVLDAEQFLFCIPTFSAMYCAAIVSK